MPKQKGKMKKGKWIWWVVCLVLLAFVAGVTFLVWNNHFRKSEGGEVEVTQEITATEESDGGGNMEEWTEEHVDDDDDTGGKKVVQYEGENPNKAAGLTGTITYAGVVGENLIVRTNIDQFVSEGVCELEISKNGNMVYTTTVGIDAGASTSSCSGFDVPVEEIGAGEFQINIKMSSGERAGTLTQEVTI